VQSIAYYTGKRVTLVFMAGHILSVTGITEEIHGGETGAVEGVTLTDVFFLNRDSLIEPPVEQAYVPMSNVTFMRPASPEEAAKVNRANRRRMEREDERRIEEYDDGDPGDEQGRKVETVELPEEPPF
jgi:hypothetical protein